MGSPTLFDIEPILLKPQRKLSLNTYLNKGLGFIPWSINISGNLIKTEFSNESMTKENIVNLLASKAKAKLKSNYSGFLNLELGVSIKYIQNQSSVNSSEIE
ncbi:MAG: hypothetical protein ACK5L5_07545 [Bacteroidales bacterium]